MSIKDWPIVQGTPAQEKAHQDAVRKGLQEQGAAARATGLPKTKCPAFVDPDMGVDWCIGWTYEDSILTGRRDRKTGRLID